MATCPTTDGNVRNELCPTMPRRRAGRERTPPKKEAAEVLGYGKKGLGTEVSQRPARTAGVLASRIDERVPRWAWSRGERRSSSVSFLRSATSIFYGPPPQGCPQHPKCALPAGGEPRTGCTALRFSGGGVAGLGDTRWRSAAPLSQRSKMGPVLFPHKHHPLAAPPVANLISDSPYVAPARR